MPNRYWKIERSTGSAAQLHDRPIPDELEPTIWLHQLERPALVLGSTQSADLVQSDAARNAGIEVCSRRSGGGLVSINPQLDIWLDILIPTRSPLWRRDVTAAFDWVGIVWEATLQRHFPSHASEIVAYTGPQQTGEYGRTLCFAGLGRGEVTVADHKVVGLSQKRNRAGARFQCLYAPHYNHDAFAGYVNAAIPADLPIGLPTHVSHRPDKDTIIETFLNLLPSPL